MLPVDERSIKEFGDMFQDCRTYEEPLMNIELWLLLNERLNPLFDQGKLHCYPYITGPIGICLGPFIRYKRN